MLVRTVRTSMYVFAAIAALFLGSPQAPVNLVRVLPANAVETYKVEYHTEAMQSGGDTSLTTKMHWTQELAFGQPDAAANRVPFKINIKERSFVTNIENSNGAPSPSQTIDGWSLGADNLLRKASLEDAAKRERMNFFAELPVVYISFPKTPVKIGDTWEIAPLITSQFDDKATALKVTFAGEKELGGKQYWNLKIDEIKDYKHGYAEDENATSSGKARIILDCLIDKQTGRQEVTDIKISGHNIYRTGEMVAESDFLFKVSMVFDGLRS